VSIQKSGKDLKSDAHTLVNTQAIRSLALEEHEQEIPWESNLGLRFRLLNGVKSCHGYIGNSKAVEVRVNERTGKRSIAGG